MRHAFGVSVLMLALARPRLGASGPCGCCRLDAPGNRYAEDDATPTAPADFVSTSCNTSVLGIEPPVADFLNVLDRREAWIDCHEFSPDPLHERPNICLVPVLAGAGDEPSIMHCVIHGAVGMEATRYQQRHDFVFHDGQTDIPLLP
jgi:hypothetical protein